MAVRMPASPSSSPLPSPRSAHSPSYNAAMDSLSRHPTNPQRRSKVFDRPTSYAKNRMSSYSTKSNRSSTTSRRASAIYPVFQSNLSYTLVRDFSYPPSHPLHYGPPPDPSASASGQSTPGFELRDSLGGQPQTPLALKTNWAEHSSEEDGPQLSHMAFGDSYVDHGPPYSEDEDLQSPVVISSRHRKSYNKERGLHPRTNGGSDTYYVSDGDEMADGPGGEFITHPADTPRSLGRTQHPRRYHGSDELDSGPPSAKAHDYNGQGLQPPPYADESRFSRDYSFTIASPDEEMHGKAVALFDFVSENENELPLVEGQIIWVSYRHGQGWLVAEDPKTRESGLVPEEYVRLLRDIEGGWTSLSGEAGSLEESPAVEAAVEEPTVSMHNRRHVARNSSISSITSNGEKRAPIISTFSTSSKDLDPYPHSLPGKEAGQQPPQVVHYNGQANAPAVQGSAVTNVKRNSGTRRASSRASTSSKRSSRTR